MESLNEALKGINREWKKAWVFAKLYGYTHQEVATNMGKPRATIKTWVNRTDKYLGTVGASLTDIEGSVVGHCKGDQNFLFRNDL